MSPSLIIFCLWVLLASAIAFLPRRFLWRGAYLLIALGIPLVGWVTWQNGPFWGMLALAAGASMLRWPIFYLWRWLRGHLRGSAE